MNFIHYKRKCPGDNTIELPYCKKCAVDSITEFLKDTKYSDSILHVRAFFARLKYVKDITAYLENGRIGKLSEKLYVMRIRKESPKGAVRIYFCFSKKPSEKDTMILLDAEVVLQKKPTRIENAKQILLEYENS